jgi:hypothetical protein
LEFSSVRFGEQDEIPGKFHHLSTLPQSPNEPPARLDPPRGWVTPVIDERVVIRGEHVHAPQQQQGDPHRESISRSSLYGLA